MGEGQEKKEQRAGSGCVCKILEIGVQGKERDYLECRKRRKLKRSGFWEK